MKDHYIIKVGSMYISSAEMESGHNPWSIINLSSRRQDAKQITNLEFAQRVKYETQGTLIRVSYSVSEEVID
ncbi:hypothetical protein PBC1_003 [Bacillus phage PBC1]|uniref:Uncharacterized protein n=1 Tax=Bacillus phage PBC1 TaxID=1161901 RepID=I1TLD7_9CAUD|nr:hypothetical protein PBC1_gp03 [Bacillus phage PBC1]AFE86239.1 hypothetical protein PBC1_003 [Bacillus phage PBC1]